MDSGAALPESMGLVCGDDAGLGKGHLQALSSQALSIPIRAFEGFHVMKESFKVGDRVRSNGGGVYLPGLEGTVIKAGMKYMLRVRFDIAPDEPAVIGKNNVERIQPTTAQDEEEK